MGWNDRMGFTDDETVEAYVDAVYDRAYWLRVQRRELTARYVRALEPLIDADPGDETEATA